MNRNQAKEFYPILQAYAEGRTIECRAKPNILEGKESEYNDWTEIEDITYWNNIEYRIKPEPTYHPFKDAEECWTEMQKHQPFEWVKDKDNNKFLIEGIYSDGSIYTSEEGTCSFDEVFKKYTFEDGTPFGVKVEE